MAEKEVPQLSSKAELGAGDTAEYRARKSKKAYLEKILISDLWFRKLIDRYVAFADAWESGGFGLNKDPE